MIDMKQIKENVSSKIKTYQHQEEAEFPAKETRQTIRNKSSEESSAAIGASIRIKGDVTGDENLIIQGEVEGTIVVQGHNVTISKTGKVKADIEARQIIVEGKLEGDLNGDEKVIICETGNVYGNIIAPRVKLEDGALFKGSIEMEPHAQKATSAKPIVNTMQGSDSKDLKTA